MRRLVFLLCVVILFGICSIFVDNNPSQTIYPFPYFKFESVSVAYNPPKLYKQWWKEIEDCSHLVGHYSRINWYIVPGTAFPCEDNGTFCVGFWRGDRHNIYIASLFIVTPIVVKHEMLHELLGRKNAGLYAPHDTLFTTCHLI